MFCIFDYIIIFTLFITDALLEEAVKNETLKQLLDMKEQNDKRREEQRAQYNKTFWESKYDSAYSMYKIVRSRSVTILSSDWCRNKRILTCVFLTGVIYHFIYTITPCY